MAEQQTNKQQNKTLKTKTYPKTKTKKMYQELFPPELEVNCTLTHNPLYTLGSCVTGTLHVEVGTQGLVMMHPL